MNSSMYDTELETETITVLTAAEDIPSDPVFVTAIQLILIVMIVLSNGLILAAIKKSSKLHKMTFYLLGNVAAADGSFAFSFAMRFLLKDRFGGYGCLFSNFFIMVSGGSSLSLVLITCVHNFIAVKFYAYARQAFSSRTVKIIIVLVWLFWVVFTGSSIPTADVTIPNPDRLCYIGNVYYSRYWVGSLIVICNLNFISVLILQVWTIVIIKNHQRRIQSQLRAQVRLITNGAKLRNSEKAARMTAIITFMLLLTLFSWGPLLIALTLISVCPNGCGVTAQAIPLTASLLFFNNIGNVFVYAIKCKEFREAFLNVLHRNNAIATVASTSNQNLAMVSINR